MFLYSQDTRKINVSSYNRKETRRETTVTLPSSSDKVASLQPPALQGPVAGTSRQSSPYRGHTTTHRPGDSQVRGHINMPPVQGLPEPQNINKFQKRHDFAQVGGGLNLP